MKHERDSERRRDPGTGEHEPATGERGRDLLRAVEHDAGG